LWPPSRKWKNSTGDSNVKEILGVDPKASLEKVLQNSSTSGKLEPNHSSSKAQGMTSQNPPPPLWNSLLSNLLHLIIVWSCGHYYKVQGWTHVGHMVNTLISFHLIHNATYTYLSFYLLCIAVQCLMVTTCCYATPHL